MLSCLATGSNEPSPIGNFLFCYRTYGNCVHHLHSAVWPIILLVVWHSPQRNNHQFSYYNRSKGNYDQRKNDSSSFILQIFCRKSVHKAYHAHFWAKCRLNSFTTSVEMVHWEVLTLTWVLSSHTNSSSHNSATDLLQNCYCCNQLYFFSFLLFLVISQYVLALFLLPLLLRNQLGLYKLVSGLFVLLKVHCPIFSLFSYVGNLGFGEGLLVSPPYFCY